VELGVGRAISGSGKVIVVAKYRPTGNVRGKFKTNVKKTVLSLQGRLTFNTNRRKRWVFLHIPQYTYENVR
jgi:hypothetical protein